MVGLRSGSRVEMTRKYRGRRRSRRGQDLRALVLLGERGSEILKTEALRVEGEARSDFGVAHPGCLVARQACLLLILYAAETRCDLQDKKDRTGWGCPPGQCSAKKRVWTIGVPTTEPGMSTLSVPARRLILPLASGLSLTRVPGPRRRIQQDRWPVVPVRPRQGPFGLKIVCSDAPQLSSRTLWYLSGRFCGFMGIFPKVCTM